MLILVLAFLASMGLVIGALLSSATTSEIVTQGQTIGHADAYAVDGGIEYGIQQLRTNPTWCPDVANAGSATTSIDGAAVTVTCNTTSGSLGAVANYALVSLDPNTSPGVNSSPLITQSAAGHYKCLLGPAYVAGGVNFKNLTEVDQTTPCSNNGTTQGDQTGTLYYHKSSCSVATTFPSNFVNAAQYWACTTASANVTTALPSVIPAAAPLPTTTGSCTVFYPGTYTDSNPPIFNTQNYMVSGIYYFDFHSYKTSASDAPGELDLGTSSLFGGQRSTSEQQVITSATPCNSDAAVGAGSGTGVEIILGGASWIYTKDGNVELYSRVPATSKITSCKSGTLADCEGTPRISLRTVPPSASAGGWDPSTLLTSGATCPSSISTSATCAFANGTGATGHAAVHGLVDTAEGSVSLYATSTSQAELLGGLVSWDACLQASGSAGGLVVTVQNAPTVRTTTLISTVRYGGKPITATAVVDVANDSLKTVSIDSWTVSNP